MKNTDMIEKLLIVVDMVKGFVEKGPMADPTIGEIIPEQLRVIEMIKREDEGLMFVCDSHEPGCREFLRYPPHCLRNSEEAQLVDELQPYADEAVLCLKNSTCAVFAPGFMSAIDAMTGLRQVVIVGCCTDICVLNLALALQNYLDEQDRDIRITIPVNGVATYGSETHNRAEYERMAFKLMRQAGIEIIDRYESEQ